MRRILLFLAVLAVALLIGACGGHAHPPYRTLPRPSLKHTPLVPPAGCVHTLGACLPQPKTSSSSSSTSSARVAFSLAAAVTGRLQGPDFSNNNPAPAGAWSRIAKASRFVYFKSVEGTAFTDSTARGMAVAARAHGLPVGGYDFLHVCLNDPGREAAHFVAALRAQGLLGKGALPPAADAEYPSSIGCSGRVWIQTWTDEVDKLDGHVCPIEYTGAWWWQPHIGAWWPTCRNVQLKTWVSGYGVAYPFMPAGVTHLDLWQFSDHGYNGYNSSDLTVYRSSTPFASFTGTAAKPRPGAYALYPAQRFKLGQGVRASERNTVRTWDRAHCRNPTRRRVCKSSRHHLVLLQRRLFYVAHHKPPRLVAYVKTGRWGDHRGARYQGITRRLRQR